VALAQSLGRMPCPRGTVAHACNCKGQKPRSREPTPILPNYQVLPINQLRTYGGNNLTATVDNAMSGWPPISFAWSSCQLGCLLTINNGVNGKHSGAPLISVTEERKPAAKSDPQRTPHKQCLIQYILEHCAVPAPSTPRLKSDSNSDRGPRSTRETMPCTLRSIVRHSGRFQHPFGPAWRF
jgi:hypothetical protein